MRILTYAQALNEALHQILERDDRVFLIGQGVISPWYVGSTTVGLIDRFGGRRIIDTPVSENAVTGAAVGAALAGMRPIVEHPRMDFMYLAMDQIANSASSWYFMFGSKVSVPITIWGIINRGGEQAAQHSQAIHAMFAHIPGLKVVMPSTPYDVKGLLFSSVLDENPVLFVDDRWLYDVKGEVPEGLYPVPIGKGAVIKAGTDVTMVSASYMVHEALKAATELDYVGVSAEVIDLRSISPLDEAVFLESAKKTGRLVVADGGWRAFGVSAEISAVASEKLHGHLKGPVRRVALPDSPAPASSALEKHYYPTHKDIFKEAIELVRGS